MRGGEVSTACPSKNPAGTVGDPERWLGGLLYGKEIQRSIYGTDGEVIVSEIP